MSRKHIEVLVSGGNPGYENYIKYINPYLEHFGVPYKETEKSDCDCALILVAQSGIKLSEKEINAVKSGIGLVLFSANALPEEYLCDGQNGVAKRISFTDDTHYITQLHENAEKIELYSDLEINSKSLKNSKALVLAGDIPLVEVGQIGEGKVVLWRDFSWMSHSVLGPIHGMDDIMWRSIAWAAKKPFVMQGMPPMLGMRIDDVWGAWRKESPENPLIWVDIANKYGIKPWLGLFQDNMDEATIKKTRQLVKDGKASAFPHAFAGCEWVGSDIPEHWAFFDHKAKEPYSDEVMAENAERIAKWYAEKDIPICKTALAHYYEIGANAIKHILDMGCEFIGIHMQPSKPFNSDTAWLNCGPYRNYETGSSGGERPVYYGDYLEVKEAPEYSGKLFNCVTEIRDVSGYEWYPDNDVEKTVKNGTTHLKRAFDSMVPAILFTHESCYIQQMNYNTWEESLSNITQAVKEYEPMYMTMDEICGYARAQHDMFIESVQGKEEKLLLRLNGNNDRETLCYVFKEAEGEITKELKPLPCVKGEIEISIDI